MQKIKSTEAGRAAAEKQLVELRMALIVKADNLTVKDGVPRFQKQLDASAEIGKNIPPEERRRLAKAGVAKREGYRQQRREGFT